MNLSDLIDVTVEITASTIAQEGFDTPMIFAHHNHFADLVREYPVDGFGAALVADGFVATEAGYQAAAALVKQEPVSKTFKIGKRQSADVQILKLIPTVANLALYKVLVDKPNAQTVEASFTSDASATLAEICTGLAAAINTATGDTTASGASGINVTLTSANDQQWGVHDISSNLFLLDDSASSGTLAADLDAIRAFDDAWYGLFLASSAPAAIEECADWTETTKSKLFVAQTHDMRVFDPTTYSSGNIFKSIKDQGYLRTHVTYNSRAQSFYGGAWMAQIISYEPGQADWMFATVVGAVADKLSPTYASRLEAQNGTYYVPIHRGRAITGDAKSAGKSYFLDLVQLSDWARVRSVEAILDLMTTRPKVAHTDQKAGAGIWGAYKSVIDEGVRNEAIDGDPTTWAITVPKRAQLSSQAKSQYRWPGTSFKFTPTGALHGVGPVTITLNVA